MISAFVFVLMLTIEIGQNPLGLLLLAELIGMIAELGSQLLFVTL